MRCTCVHCGSEFETATRRAQKFCSPPPGQNMSSCATAHHSRLRDRRDPAYVLRNRAAQRRYLEKIYRDPIRRKAREDKLRSPEARAAKAAYNLAYRRSRGLSSAPLAGSVLAASSTASPGREVLAYLLDRAPRGSCRDTREEVVACAALLHLEGHPLDEALALASEAVRRDASRLRHARPIQECYWL